MSSSAGSAPPRVVQITDWLPPEFSAVSQYALLIAEREARAGADTIVVGLTSGTLNREERAIGAGRMTILPVRRDRYDKDNWAKRLLWSLTTNFILVRKAWPHLRACDTIRFTGSPPFLLHFLFFANLITRKKLVYRITDFYPECIIAAMRRPSVMLEMFRRFTNVLRRRIDRFEAIGNDMKRRLLACGVAPERIILSRDSSPVDIDAQTKPLSLPAELAGRHVLLYSGNWGVAHEIDTFFEGYRRHHRNGDGSVMLWLNATGSGAEEMNRRLVETGLPFFRQKLVPLEDLPNLLVTPDMHLVTLRPEFMGFVLPSKIYGCVASKRPVLFIGPEGSDVHELCLESDAPYRRVDVGDAAGVETALNSFPWPARTPAS